MIIERKKIKKMYKNWFEPLEDYISFVFICEVLIRVT